MLIRLLQTLGAYEFRGYYANKSHFLLSIPFALKNLQWLVEKNHIPKNLPELKKVITSILMNEDFRKPDLKISSDKLKVTINSFSYKQGIPKDFSGNGGGFVFDCRSLENPGRYAEYVNSTGLDENVINFLQDRNDVKTFLDSVYSIVDAAVENYSDRGFKNLMVSFGCTGGQHRSVYCAENFATHIEEKFNVVISLNHTQINQKGNLARFAVMSVPTLLFFRDGQVPTRRSASCRSSSSPTSSRGCCDVQAFLERINEWGYALSETLQGQLDAGSAAAFLVVFLAGVLTSFTPCVYPMIPVTVTFIGGAAGGNRRRAVLLSSVYVLGMALIYAALGVVAALIGKTFGDWTRNPWVYGAVGLLIVGFGVAMLDVVSVRVPAFFGGLQRQGVQKGGFVGALLMGVAAGFVAG